jgi:hypothetical protein
MDVGQKVRLVRTIDLGSEGKIDAGTIGILESMENSPYLPFLVRFPQGALALEDGDIEDIEE